MTTPQHGPDAIRLSSCVYELAERDEMPTVDLSRSLGHTCCQSCSSQVASDPSTCHWSVKASWLASFFLSPFAIVLSLRADETFGRQLAILALIINLPLWAIQFRALRFDVVRLVVRTPEFWYFMINSTLWCLLLAVYLNGVRSIVAFVFFMMSLAIVLVDADTMFTHRVVLSAILGVVINFAVIIFINRRAINAVNAFSILPTRPTALQVEDVIISGLITNTFYLVRNAYRRQRELAEQRRIHCLLLRCIVFRRRARLRLVTETAASTTHTPASCIINPTVVRMVCVPTAATFPAQDTVLSMDLTGPPWNKRVRILIAVTAWTSIILTVAAFFGPIRTTARAPHRIPVGAVALVLSMACCGLFWGLCQRKLLRHIVQTFDFLYLSLQLTLAHLCVCDFVRWDDRKLAVLCSWLWMHVVLTSDALTPVVRAKTGLRERFLAPVLTIFIAGLIRLAVDLIVDDDEDTGMGVVFAFSLGGRKVEVRTLRLFMTRLLSILWWSLRVLARVWAAREGDMVELRMRVAYAANLAAGHNHDVMVEQHVRQRRDCAGELRAPTSTHQVAPMLIGSQRDTK